METVAIVGVGLIGGSFGLALRKAGFHGRILGVSSSRSIEAGIAAGAIDAGAGLAEAAKEADLVYLAQPISGILKTIQELAPFVRATALVTDAGSTKSKIVQEYREKLIHTCYVGGHPMAGKEQRGAQAADANLFEGRTYFLCPDGEGALDKPAVQEFEKWLRRIGAVPVVIEPERHDELVAFTSHLAQMSSTALAATLADVFDPDQARAGAGSGLTDMTRLSLSSWDIWRDILATNATAIDSALELYIEKLQQIRTDLRSPEASKYFESSKNFTKRLRKLDR